MDYKNNLLEFLGTFLLVFLGTGSIILDEIYHGILGAFGIGVVFGLSVWGLIFFIGKYSDCHINPAVTIAFYKDNQIGSKKAISYIIAQLLGAVCASFLLHNLFIQNIKLGATLPSGSWFASFLLEVFMSFMLMLVIFVTISFRTLMKFAPFLIGFTVFLEAWLGGPISGASMNPARSFGPAVVSGNLQSLELYFMAPILGMLLAQQVMKIKTLSKF